MIKKKNDVLNENTTMPPTNKKQQLTHNNSAKKNRFLITVNVLGSAGPIRFLVNENDLVSSIIDTALKTFAREGRLPVLGFDVHSFLLYCANEGSDALNPSQAIGSCGGRNFLLCKKQLYPQMTEGRARIIARKGVGWRAWLNKINLFQF